MTTSKKSSYLEGLHLFGTFLTYLIEPRKKNILVEKKPKQSKNWPGGQSNREKTRRRAQIARGMHRECMMVPR